MRLPTFLIPGAPKCGSTTLFRWLQSHPDVFMPERKEPNFFGQNWDKGLAWYADFFAEAGDRRAVGECSVWTMGQAEAPARVRATIPDVRLVFLLRDPARRAWSEYWFRRQRGDIDMPPLAEYVRTPEGQRSLLRTGLYRAQLEAWLAEFPRERMLFLATEALSARPRESWQRACVHIGVDPASEPDFGERHNETRVVGNPAAFRSAKAAWRAASRALDAVGLRPVTDAVRRRRLALQGVMLRDGRPPELDEPTRAFLADYYREDAAALAEDFGVDVSAWKE